MSVPFYGITIGKNLSFIYQKKRAVSDAQIAIIV